MTSSNGASGNAGGGKSSPGSSKASFTAARDGKTSEPARSKSPTEQQKRAATKVVNLQNQNASNLEVQSAKSALTFNVQAEGVAKSKSTVEPKSKTQASYKAQDGKTYTSQAAIAAAKNLDKSKKASKAKTTIKSHPAPAPKPPGVARNANRGRSVAQPPQQTTKQQSKAGNDNSKLTAYQKELLANVRKEQAQQPSKAKAANQEMGR